MALLGVYLICAEQWLEVAQEPVYLVGRWHRAEDRVDRILEFSRTEISSRSVIDDVDVYARAQRIIERPIVGQQDDAGCLSDRASGKVAGEGCRSSA